MKLRIKTPECVRKSVRVIKKHSPEICLAVGAVGTVVGTVMACKATLKAADRIYDKQEEVGPMTDKSEITQANLECYCDVAKYYAPSVIIMSLSMVSLFAGNRILKKRCAMYAAAYTTVNTAYQNYRQAVREKFGVDVDRELAHNAYTKTIKDEEGKKQKALIVDPNLDYSPYARFFDSASRLWTKSAADNCYLLHLKQAEWNQKLMADGYVYLNDVLRDLDIPEIPWAQNVGWVYDPRDTSIDSKIDFGVFQAQRPKCRDFVNGYENVIILDFNVDGDISYILDTKQPKDLPMHYRDNGSKQLEYIGGSDNE